MDISAKVGRDHANQITKGTERTLTQSLSKQVSHHAIAGTMDERYHLGLDKLADEVILNLDVLRPGVEDGF